jgi:mevalonate kinase
MPAISASAPGKVILFGEHAVVYERPAIAVPVNQVAVRAVVLPIPTGHPGQVQIDAPDVGLHTDLKQLSADHPLALLLATVQAELNLSHLPALSLWIKSTIPVAAGLGSGAAVSVAITRALSEFLGHPLPDERISEVAFRIERKYHGTPSGIDNTVITYAQPIYFIKGQPFERLSVQQPFNLVIADSGIKSETSAVVGDVRSHWQAAPERYETLFDAIGGITRKAREIIEEGSTNDLGPLMNENQHLLQAMGVSCPELDQLVHIALESGALGAKLAGAGRGGNMIALVDRNQARNIARDLRSAGATRTIITEVPAIKKSTESG